MIEQIPTIKILKVGSNRCQCQTCKRFFSSESAFDKHRIARNGKRICAKPETVNLELKTWGGYGGIGSFPHEGRDV